MNAGTQDISFLEGMAKINNLRPNPPIKKWERKRGPGKSFIITPELILLFFITKRLSFCQRNIWAQKKGMDLTATRLLKEKDLLLLLDKMWPVMPAEKQKDLKRIVQVAKDQASLARSWFSLIEAKMKQCQKGGNQRTPRGKGTAWKSENRASRAARPRPPARIRRAPGPAR
jgi:hypothetical protein